MYSKLHQGHSRRAPNPSLHRALPIQLIHHHTRGPRAPAVQIAAKLRLPLCLNKISSTLFLLSPNSGKKVYPNQLLHPLRPAFSLSSTGFSRKFCLHPLRRKKTPRSAPPFLPPKIREKEETTTSVRPEAEKVYDFLRKSYQKSALFAEPPPLTRAF